MFAVQLVTSLVYIGSNVTVEQETAVLPICGKLWEGRWLLFIFFFKSHLSHIFYSPRPGERARHDCKLLIGR